MTTNAARRWIEARPGRKTWAVTATGVLLSAALLAACARLELSWLVFAALVPWMFAVDRLTRWSHALAAGAALAALFTVAVFGWFPAAAARYSGLPSPVLWALFLLLAPLVQPQFCMVAVARCLLRGQDRLSPVRVAAGSAAVYVGTELLFPKLFFDTIGQGVYPSASLRQGAAVASVHGVTLAILLVSDAVLWAVAPARDAVARASTKGRAAKIRFAPLGAAVALVAVWLATGAARRSALSAPAPDHVDVGVVQANITAYDKLRAEKGAFEAVEYILDTHMGMSSALIAEHPPDVLVWPETVYPTTFGSPKSEAGRELDLAIEGFTVTRSVPLVFGAYDAEEGREYNAAFFLTPIIGERPRRTVYRKRMLFPVTEWVPEWLDGPRLRRALPWAGTWSRGAEPHPIDVPVMSKPSFRVIPLICYDALFPGLVAEAAEPGADMILTLSNDSWFPDSRAPRLHLLSAAFRSVETGLPQVRATNSGVSALISAAGDIEGEIPWDTRRTMLARVPVRPRAKPPAVTWGPRLPSICGVVAVGALLHAWRSRKKSERSRS